MTPLRPPPRRTELHRTALVLGTLACALAWGLLELLALQRHRLQGVHRWRLRHPPPPRH